MNIVQRAREFVQQQRVKTDWQRCPYCGSKQTQRHGRYERHPWRLCSRQTVSVQRHRCLACGRTYSELPSGVKANLLFPKTARIILPRSNVRLVDYASLSA